LAGGSGYLVMHYRTINPKYPATIVTDIGLTSLRLEPISVSLIFDILLPLERNNLLPE
jgi:hypothetical protein